MAGVSYTRRTDDGVIGTSGTPKDIYGYQIVSGAGGGAVVDFHDGTGTTGTKVLVGTGTADQSVVNNFGGQAIRFPSGCYVNVDANTASITVFYQEVI